MIHFLLALMAIGVATLALWPGARIQRTVKVLLRKLVLNPHVRLYLNLDIAPPMSLRALQKLVGTWTSATFVQAGGIGACNHIVDEAKELKEILQKIIDAKLLEDDVDPEDQYNLDLELADIQILIMDIAHCRGTDLTDATLLKHHINTLRKWSPPDERGVQHHIESPVDTGITWKRLKDGKVIFQKGGRTPEEELRLLKNFSYLGKKKLAAIIAKPDADIAAAMSELLNDTEPLSGGGFGRKLEDFVP